MGKLEDDSSINHFSHEHALKLQNLQSRNKTACLACNGNVSDSFFYTCVSCDFYLHKTCSNIPQTLKHPSDELHDLVLLSSPAYPEGVFRCNACGSHGDGFSYHCPDCQLDLHVVCASKPPSVDHVAHGHTLGLCFRSPYENEGFSCDICNGTGSNQWLYRCGVCEFDAHVNCVMARTTSRALLPKSTSLPHNRTHHLSPPPPLPPRIATTQPPTCIIYYTPPAQNPQILLKSTSLPPYETHHFPPPPLPPLIQPYDPRVPPLIGGSFINNMAGHAVEGFAGSVTQELIQSVLGWGS